MYKYKLIIEKSLWIELVDQLKERGMGTRESGAFLLGSIDEKEITHFICYDELDPDCLDLGYIRFKGSGYTKLWKFCNENQLKVHADIHTHPKGRTQQSNLDLNHPMIAQSGHVALILPHYAQVKNQLLQGVGIYEYLGDKEWTNFNEHFGLITY